MWECERVWSLLDGGLNYALLFGWNQVVKPENILLAAWVVVRPQSLRGLVSQRSFNTHTHKKKQKTMEKQTDPCFEKKSVCLCVNVQVTLTPW